jgi:hypothetical protein
MGSTKQRFAVMAFWIALAVAIGWGAVQLGLGSFGEPGPGFMPMLTAGLIFVLTIANLFEKAPAGRKSPFPDRPVLLRLVLTMGGLWIYAFALPWIGFIADTLILMTFLFAVIQKVKWPVAILAALLSVGICYLLFSSLGTEFPRGVFFS